LINLKEIKSKVITKVNLYCFVVISIIFFLDRYTKSLILKHLSENTYYFNNYINLDLVWNTGIGFGLFRSNSEIIYNLISLLIASVIIFLIYFLIASDKFEKVIYSIIVGGALGNFYDRMLFKAVPDFIDLHYLNFHWFTFNIADIFITLGILGFIMKEFLIKNN